MHICKTCTCTQDIFESEKIVRFKHLLASFFPIDQIIPRFNPTEI